MDETDREAVYRLLAKRVRLMFLSEEAPVWKVYRLPILERLSALTDGVVFGMIGLPEAERVLNEYIESLRPQEGVIRY